jgi:hypothetical protein
VLCELTLELLVEILDKLLKLLLLAELLVLTELVLIEELEVLMEDRLDRLDEDKLELLVEILDRLLLLVLMEDRLLELSNSIMITDNLSAVRGPGNCSSPVWKCKTSTLLLVPSGRISVNSAS